MVPKSTEIIHEEIGDKEKPQQRIHSFRQDTLAELDSLGYQATEVIKAGTDLLPRYQAMLTHTPLQFADVPRIIQFYEQAFEDILTKLPVSEDGLSNGAKLHMLKETLDNVAWITQRNESTVDAVIIHSGNMANICMIPTNHPYNNRPTTPLVDIIFNRNQISAFIKSKKFTKEFSGVTLAYTLSLIKETARLKKNYFTINPDKIDIIGTDFDDLLNERNFLSTKAQITATSALCHGSFIPYIKGLLKVNGIRSFKQLDDFIVKTKGKFFTELDSKFFPPALSEDERKERGKIYLLACHLGVADLAIGTTQPVLTETIKDFNKILEKVQRVMI